MPDMTGLLFRTDITLMLESLLRVQDFENFESLLPLLESTPIAERERRELLAQMYLRRGFLRSAGREWMAVCREQPDARALYGLARVAERQGMPAEALDFAQGALRLEAEHAGAAELLERVRGNDESVERRAAA